MQKKSLRVAAVIAVATALTIPAGVAVADTTTPPPPPAAERTTQSSIQGKARMDYPRADEDVRVSVDAHSTFARGNKPLKSWGTFRISHKQAGPDGKVRDYWGDFKVDCLTTGGPTATVTGTLERTSPGHPWVTMLDEHVRMGVSFYVPEPGKGGGPARIGLSGAALKEEKKPPLTPCMAPAADSAVIAGGYTLKDRR
ncbi:hypothetical protein [Streptomyces sp. NPDC021096]|uniref:hypothetical protein n=1 Tax=Streptomyces sp. NPDC021096 TaxID=3154792 RepID=UPI0033E17E30